ncbi:cytochrome P450 [Mycobacterium kiyosense]|nr:hypothetical protein IWGMT90018_43870 [Mycobacterium kiyosense]
MTETAQDQPTMMDAFRSTWDTCELFAQLRHHAPIMHVPELDAWVLSRYDDILPIIQDVDRFGCMPDDLVGDVPDELKDALPHGYAPLATGTGQHRSATTHPNPKIGDQSIDAECGSGTRGRDQGSLRPPSRCHPARGGAATSWTDSRPRCPFTC